MSTNVTKTLRGRRDTGVAKLPGLPAVSTGNASLDAWITAATERLEVREGQRGNGFERAVTVRELKDFTAKFEQAQSAALQNIEAGTAIAISVGGMTATMAIKKFEDAIRATKLYQDLKKRLDDPSRFDDLRVEVREELLRDLAQLAREQGAKVERLERIITDRNLALSMRIETVTAAAADAAAGARELVFASAEQGRAQAGKITQLEASLGNYYQDGKPGRANLEQSMTVTADRVEGLRSQYTLKVQAGGSLAGFGLSATEKDGKPDSAFIIAANKFAIVNPATYTAGLTNTPDAAHIPFGVDANGIYMNSNVYVKGNMRVDTGGKTLSDGLRGSLDVNSGASETTSWSDTTARNTIWRNLGKSGNAPNNNHLVIGDMVTIGKTTKQWMGSYWDDPGIVINGSMLVNGTIAGQKLIANTITADKIDSRGLTIKDANGNIILGAGNNLDFSRINGLGSLARQSTVATSQLTGNLASSRITGLGALATQNAIEIPESPNNSQVYYTYNGVTYKVGATAFVTELNKIKSTNIGTYMESAAIGSAYIGNAAVGTLHIQGNAVTVPQWAQSINEADGAGWDGNHWNWKTFASRSFYMPEAGKYIIIVNGFLSATGSGWDYAGFGLWVNGTLINTIACDKYMFGGTICAYVEAAKGSSVLVDVRWSAAKKMRFYKCYMVVMGCMR